MHEIYYHTKPYLLMGGGALTLTLAGNAVMTVGGVILILMGAIIWKMRN